MRDVRNKIAPRRLYSTLLSDVMQHDQERPSTTAGDRRCSGLNPGVAVVDMQRDGRSRVWRSGHQGSARAIQPAQQGREFGIAHDLGKRPAFDRAVHARLATTFRYRTVPSASSTTIASRLEARRASIRDPLLVKTLQRFMQARGHLIERAGEFFNLAATTPGRDRGERA